MMKRVVAVLLLFGGVWTLLATIPPRSLAQPAAAASLDDPAAVPRMSVEALKKLLHTDKVVVVDVRGDASYKAGHIWGAISMPLEAVEKRAAELKDEKRTIVTYCS
jgi:3-mercaptopyruvate sulfurtransferase SseA